MFLPTFILKKKLEIVLITSFLSLSYVILTNYVLLSIKNLSYNQVQNEIVDNFECDFKQATEMPLKYKLKSILNCRDRALQMETLQYGKYWLLKNYIRGRLSINMDCVESITYTTNGDYTFLENLPTVVGRWLAPISFAIFAPGHDYDATMDSIQYVRNCLPESQLIRDYVTFHIYFPNNHMPSFVAKNEEEAIKWPYDCQLKEAPYENVKRSAMYKTQKNMTYPINVGRNIARRAANTYFVFACDIELYPSLNLVKQFLEMIANNASIISTANKPKVFPLPVFEINENATLPDSKEELKQMLNTGMAITFHYKVCPYCHLVPRQNEWMAANETADLEVFSITKRQGKFASWEPFYISDNKEPIFDERVTWEGQSNKRIQNYAMCLMDYEYHVLHPAFLVHAPGIKQFNPKSVATKKRMKSAAQMTKYIRTKIMPEYRILYSNNSMCRV